MATGAEIIGAKLFWALGYNTSEYHIVRFRPSDLVVSGEAEVALPGRGKRALRREDLDRLLASVDREPDGSYRALASKALPGRYVGRIRYDGTRRDDPNDIVPHEHHRELRGYRVFAAWLDHVDAKENQSLVAEVTEGGHTFLRTYLLDWGSILGSAALRPREYWEGYEPLIERPGPVARRAASLGLIVPAWRRMPFYEAPSVGRLPRDEMTWDPERWQPHVQNAAFRHARADDEFWAATKIACLDEPIIRAAVAEAELGDPDAEEHLVRMILGRRERILSTYLNALDPIVDPALGNGSRLRFHNAAVELAGSEPPRGYRAIWRTFDNETGATAPLGVTEGPGPELAVPPLPEAGFLEVELASVGAERPAWEEPILLHFRRREDAWELVGLQRMPDAPGPEAEQESAGAVRTHPGAYPELGWWRDASMLGTGVTLLQIGSRLPVHRQDVPPEGLDPARIRWSFDRSVIGERSTRADTESDYYRDALIAYPMVLAFVSQPPGTRWGGTLRRSLMYAEAIGLSEGITAIVKSTDDRPRPFTYLPSEERPDNGAFDVTLEESFRSMPSGHATITFCAAGFAMTDHLLTRPDAGWAENAGVAFVAGFLAGITAELRIEGGQHFPSDTIVGGLIGTAAGVSVPLLHRSLGPERKRGRMPPRRAWLQAIAGEIAGIGAGVLSGEAY